MAGQARGCRHGEGACAARRGRGREWMSVLFAVCLLPCCPQIPLVWRGLHVDHLWLVSCTVPPCAVAGSSKSIKEQLREVLREERQANAPRRKPFSEVSETEAGNLLWALDIPEMDGNLLHPIVASDGQACTAFDFSQYKDENEGHAALMQHHQAQLEMLGVKFGTAGGYAIYDLHDQEALYEFTAMDCIYSGSVDCGVAPFGLMRRSAGNYCYVMYVHKQSDAQRAAYRARKVCRAVRCGFCSSLRSLQGATESGVVLVAATRSCSNTFNPFAFFLACAGS